MSAVAVALRLQVGGLIKTQRKSQRTKDRNGLFERQMILEVRRAVLADECMAIPSQVD